MIQKLNNRYELIEKLGSGANGITYLANDSRTNKQVVVKRLRHELNDKTRKIWPREVQILRGLDHPNIPRFIDFFEQTVELERLPHIVQGYVAGDNLQKESETKHYTPTQVLDMVISLIEVLCYLQSLSPPVLHRDIKPENIIRQAKTNRLFLIDFGTATSAKGQTFGHTMVAGTLGYQSLEQIEGDPGLSSDLYSIGVIAVQLLSDRSIEDLYVGMGRIRWMEALPHTPKPIIAFLEKMLALRANDRYPDAEQALQAAKRCMAQIKGLPEPERPQKPKQKKVHVFAPQDKALNFKRPSIWRRMLRFWGCLVPLAIGAWLVATAVWRNALPCNYIFAPEEACLEGCQKDNYKVALKHCETFLRKFPDSELKEKALEAKASAEFDKAWDDNSSEAYKQFLQGPDSIFTAQAYQLYSNAQFREGLQLTQLDQQIDDNTFRATYSITNTLDYKVTKIRMRTIFKQGRSNEVRREASDLFVDNLGLTKGESVTAVMEHPAPKYWNSVETEIRRVFFDKSCHLWLHHPERAVYGNCDLDYSNHCETNIKTNNDHCGSCNMVCQSGKMCIDGKCE